MSFESQNVTSYYWLIGNLALSLTVFWNMATYSLKFFIKNCGPLLQMETWLLLTALVAYLGFSKRGHGERAEREPMTGVWGGAPAGSRGRAPGRGVKAPLKLKHFLLLNVQWKLQKRTFSYKVACKKFSWSGQRGGHCSMAPPKYTTDYIHVTVTNDDLQWWHAALQTPTAAMETDDLLLRVRGCGTIF